MVRFLVRNPTLAARAADPDWAGLVDAWRMGVDPDGPPRCEMEGPPE